MDDLWGELNLKKISTPKSILQEQAALLTNKTNGVLEGLVRTTSSGKELITFFEIRVPLMDGYSFSVLRVHSSISVYPALLVDLVRNSQVKCGSEAEFKVTLRDLLSNPEVRNILSALISQVSDEPKETPS